MTRETKERIERNALRRNPNFRQWNIDRMRSRGQIQRAWWWQVARNTRWTFESLYAPMVLLYGLRRSKLT